MSIDRTTLLRGPGYISVGAATIHPSDNITATLIEEWSDTVTSGYGRTGRSLINRRIEVSATPIMWSALSTLYPYAAAQRDDPIYGATDVPLTIIPRNGRDLIVANAAITQLSNLRFGAADNTFSGPTVWTGLVANGTSAGSLANYYARGSTRTNYALPGYDPSAIKRTRYTAARNGVLLRSDTPFDVQFSMSLQPAKPEGEPTVGMYLDSLDATIQCRPVGLTETDYDALLNDGVDIGGEPTLYNTTITGAGSGMPTFTLSRTMVEASGWEWGGAARTGALTLASVRGISANLLSPLWTIGSTA